MPQIAPKLLALRLPRTCSTAFVVGMIVAAGLALRTFHYLGGYTIWYDEAVLLANILDKNFLGLLGRLDYEVAAPPLFLWTLKCLSMISPDNVYVWRCVPFVASCITLMLTARVMQRLLSPIAAISIVALVAFSNAHQWLGCCVKPYALDACIATALLYAYGATRDWPVAKRIVLFAAVAPVLICFSYPALFLYGTLLAALLPAAWSQPGSRPKLAWIGLGAVVFATFVALYFGPIKAQRVSGLVSGWQPHFPDWNSLWYVPLWSMGATYTVFHYLYNPSGALCLLLCVAGARVCWRQKQFDWLILAAGPLLVGYLAACAHLYPYGNNRLMLFAAPGIGVLAGMGIPPVFGWLRQKYTWGSVAFISALLVPVFAYSTYRLIIPWDQPDSSGTSRAIRANLQPDDLVGSDEDTYAYFFHGRRKPLATITQTPHQSGTRLWVAMDHYTPDFRRECVVHSIRETEWMLVREEIRERSSLFLFVKK